jgi:hypothetical protein
MCIQFGEQSDLTYILTKSAINCKSCLHIYRHACLFLINASHIVLQHCIKRVKHVYFQYSLNKVPYNDLRMYASCLLPFFKNFFKTFGRMCFSSTFFFSKHFLLCQVTYAGHAYRSSCKTPCCVPFSKTEVAQRNLKMPHYQVVRYFIQTGRHSSKPHSHQTQIRILITLYIFTKARIVVSR